jgi:DNA-binding IscR family transcriptional regulator
MTTIVIKTIDMKEPARFDAYLVETLMPDLVGHDRQPSAFLVYLYLAHQAARARARSVAASLQTIAADTGLSKSAVQRGLRTLARRRLVRVEKTSPTAVPSYVVLRPWVRR